MIEQAATSGPPPETPPALGGRLLSRRTIASFLFAFALLAWVLNRLGSAQLAEIWSMVHTTKIPIFGLAFLAYYTAFPIRAVRWRCLLENAGVPSRQIPSYRSLASVIFLSWFANSLVPAKLGDIYRGYLLKRHAGASWSLAMGTIVAERVLDLVVLVVLMVTSGIFTYYDRLRSALVGGVGACYGDATRPDRLSCALLELLELGMLVVLVVIIALVVFARQRHRLAGHLPDRLAAIYHRFSAGLVLSFARFPRLIGLSILAWSAEGTAFWFVSRALGQALPVPVVVFFSLLQAFITVIPVTPGGLGFEVLLAAALRLHGLTEAAAWALTFLYRSISYVSLVLLGAIAYLVFQLMLRRPT